MKKVNDKKIFETAGVIIVWLSVILQLVLIIQNRVASIPETIIRFFSYYTILTNILVGIAFTSMVGIFGEKWKQRFSRITTFTAVTVYILVVSITYNLILRGLVELKGLQIFVDEMLHLIIPIFVFIYWLSYVAKSSIEWKSMFPWMWYPLIYCVYVLIRGAFSGFYPYPFMNVSQLGYSKVIVNCIYVTLAFIAVSFLLIGYTKFRKQRITT